MSARKVIFVLSVLLGINLLLASTVNGQGSSLNNLPADTITDGKPRYSVRKTGTEDTKNLRKKTADLKDPDNLKTEVIYDEKDNTYTIGTSLGGSDATTTGRSTGGARSTGRSTSTSRNPSRNQSTSTPSSSQTGAA